MKKLTALREEMVRQDITSLKISQDLGINSCQFSLYLNGWRRMPNYLKKDVAEYLKVEPCNLFDDWEEAQPDSYFRADVSFNRVLEYLGGREKNKSHASRLYEFGSVLAKEVDDLVREANLDDNLPRLGRYNRRGERIEGPSLE